VEKSWRSRGRGRQKSRWIDGVEGDSTKLGCGNWRAGGRSDVRGSGRRQYLLEEAKAHRGEGFGANDDDDDDEDDLDFILYKIKYSDISVTICRALVRNESVILNKAAFSFLFVILKLKWKEELPAVTTTTTTYLQCRAVYFIYFKFI